MVLALLCACRRSGGGGDEIQVVRALDPPASIGSETAIDSVAYTDREGDQTSPFAVAGGPGALIVWRGNSRPMFAVSELLIYAARIDASGTPLELVPAAVTAPVGESDQWQPIAGWNGDRALVVLTETLSGHQLQGARIERDGTVLDRIPFAISTTDLHLRTPIAVLPDGTGFVVLWAEDGAYRITTVASDGTVAQVGGTAVALPTDDPTLVISGVFRAPGWLLLMLSSGHLNAGQTIFTDVKTAAISTSGALLAPISPPVTATVVGARGMGFTGSTALAVWAQSAGTGMPTTILGRRFASDGSWIDAAPFEVRPAGGAVGQVGAVWNGTSFLCYWTDASQSITRVRLVLRRFDANGAPIDAQPTPAVAPASDPVGSVQIIWTGTSYVAVMNRTIYTSEGGTPGDFPDGVLARPIDANLQLGGADAVPIDTQPNTQSQYRAVGSPGAAYAVWSDDRRESSRNSQGRSPLDIYGARVTVAGASLAQTVTPLVTTNEEKAYPVIAWDGTQFTASYQVYDNSGTVRRVLRVPSSGSPVIGPGTSLSIRESGPEMLLLWNGSNFPLAWIDTYFANVRRLSAAGTVLDTQPLLLPRTTGVHDESALGGVTLNGSSLLVWQSNYPNVNATPSDEHDIEGGVVFADGTPAATTVSSIAAGAGPQDRPAIATDGASALVVWRDRASAPQRILGARFDGRLNRLDAADAVIAEAAAPDTLGPPVVAWTGTRYVASWTRNSSGKVTFAACPLGSDRRCQTGTDTAAPSNIAVQPTETILNPSLVWTDAGGVLFYRRLDTTPNVNKERLFARAVSSGGAPTPPDLDGGAGGAGGGPGDGGTADARDGGTADTRDGGAGGGAGTSGGGSGGAGGANDAGGRGGAATSGGGGSTAGAGGSGSGGAGAGGAAAGSGGAGMGGAGAGHGGAPNGSAGTGGVGARGGASGGPGAGGATGGGPGGSPPASGSGCGCEVSGRGPPTYLVASPLLLLSLIARRRRRARP